MRVGGNLVSVRRHGLRQLACGTPFRLHSLDCSLRSNGEGELGPELLCATNVVLSAPGTVFAMPCMSNSNPLHDLAYVDPIRALNVARLLVVIGIQDGPEVDDGRLRKEHVALRWHLFTWRQGEFHLHHLICWAGLLDHDVCVSGGVEIRRREECNHGSVR